MDYANPDSLVSAEWLADSLGRDDLALLDASWHLAAAGRDAKAEFAEARIPGAQFFDVDDIADPGTDLPHMIPRPEIFRTKVSALGVGGDKRVVVYDSNGGCMAAARAWWMFRLFGHDRVALLNGGLGKWKAEGRELETGPWGTPAPGDFTPRLDGRRVRTIEKIRANLESKTEQVVDARSPGRLAGTEPEPRPGVRSGRIPGSLNLPFQELMDVDNHFQMKPADELEGAFADAGVDLSRPVISSCGSGITAAVAILALDLLGHADNAVYDGSWTEWGGRQDTPIEI